ncbi:alpha-3 family phenol-soluble modulin [Staphylococcus aureus]|nr:alpha-3 family phenol-soluble modulin [Staphylococcus aureus]
MGIIAGIIKFIKDLLGKFLGNN